EGVVPRRRGRDRQPRALVGGAVPRPLRERRERSMTPSRALFHLNQRLLRRQGFAFAAILALFAYATAEGFRAALTVSERQLLAVMLSLMAGGVGPGDAMLIGFQVAAGALIFAAVGAVTSQLAHGRRTAAGVAGVLLGAAFLVRVVADGTRTLGSLRWCTPFG